MIKYYENPEKKTVYAVLEDTRYDAAMKIAKVLGCTKSLRFDLNKYVMPDTFKACAKCHPDDEYNPEVGMQIAKERLMRKYYKVYDKRLGAFVQDLNDAMLEVTQRF